VQTAGEIAISLAFVLLVVTLVARSHLLNKGRAAILTGLVGQPIRVGISIHDHGALPFDVVVQSVDPKKRTVRFDSLASAWEPKRPGDMYADWALWAAADTDGNMSLLYVRWAQAGDGTRWRW
jgi:hypothetical protein